MAGLNKGVVTGSAFTGARCSTALGCEIGKRKVTYYPGYVRTDGKTVNARCTVRAIVNLNNKGAQNYTFVGWGKLADFMAKRMSPGAEFSCSAKPESYLSRVYDEGGKPILRSNGSELLIEKHTFVIERDTLRMTAESRKVIDAEILGGQRPANWDDGGQGHEAWLAMQKTKNVDYDGASAIFGHAKVIKKTGVTPLSAQAPEAPANDATLAAQIAAVIAKMQGNVQSAGAGANPGNTPLW